MSEKQDIIKKLMDMQKKFIEYEHQNGVKQEDYLLAPEGHPLHHYKDEYQKLANQLVDMAHEEVGSHR